MKDSENRQMCIEVIDAFENEAMSIANILERVTLIIYNFLQRSIRILIYTTLLQTLQFHFLGRYTRRFQ